MSGGLEGRLSEQFSSVLRTIVPNEYLDEYVTCGNYMYTRISSTHSVVCP